MLTEDLKTIRMYILLPAFTTVLQAQALETDITLTMFFNVCQYAYDSILIHADTDVFTVL